MRIDTQNCDQENSLIGFLYGELDETEALAFRRHLEACAVCNTELAGLGKLRESVVAWRNESLSSVAVPNQTTDSSPGFAARPRPSAVAALREFFNLSPLWMKGAVAFAAILFCVFAGLALARLGDKPAVVVIPPAATTNSPQQINALVEQRVQEELKRIKDSNEQSSPPLTASGSPQNNPNKRIAKPNYETVATSSQRARRPLSKIEREQLAADLRLVSAKNDSDVELLDDRINQ